MISPHIREAITALLAVDHSATDAEREAVAAAMRGTNTPQVLAVSDVAKRIGRTRQTVYSMVRRGQLAPVRTSGGILSGITADSFAAYLRGA